LFCLLLSQVVLPEQCSRGWRAAPSDRGGRVKSCSFISSWIEKGPKINFLTLLGKGRVWLERF
jgi:hypothetical protein